MLILLAVVISNFEEVGVVAEGLTDFGSDGPMGTLFEGGYYRVNFFIGCFGCGRVG